MRCTRCGYISFKALKKCESCGAGVAKAAKGRSLRKAQAGEEKPFTIFPKAEDTFSYDLPTPLSAEADEGEASYLTPPGQVIHPVFNAEGDFELDLSEAVSTASSQVEESPAPRQPASATRAFGFEIPSQVYDGAEELDEIDLGEIEVEGLGFEGLDAEFSVPHDDAEDDEDDGDAGLKMELSQPQGEPVAEEEPRETPSILDELDLDFDPDEDEEAPAKGSGSKKTG